MNDTVLAAARRLAAAGIDSARLDARLLWQHALTFSSPVHGGGAAQRAAEGRRGPNRPSRIEPNRSSER